MKYSLIAALMLGTALGHTAPSFTGETGNPANSMFRRGDTVPLLFTASGLKPNEKLTLELNFVDQNEATVGKRQVTVEADASGNWRGTVNGPNERYGFYRVNARLSNGLRLPKIGSRPAGCLTYAVLPDPRTRKLYPQEETFFGIHGNAGKDANLAPWMGARWMGAGVGKSPEEVKRYQMEKKQSLWPDWLTYTYVNYRHSSDPYTFWTPEQIKKHTTGSSLGTRFADAEGEKIFIESNARLARYAALGPGNNDVARFQPLWEPDLLMSDEEIVNIYKAARQGLRSADPKALVLGPCFHSIAEGSVSRHLNLFKLGFLDYIDELTIHPYMQYPVEQNGMVENIRRLKSYIRQYAKGRDIKIRANESGYSAINDTSHELIQMYGQVRGSLIMLGEGFASNEPFYGYDHDKNCAGDYGLTYNLMMPKRIWGPNLVSPRPVFPALAALSYILEGHRPTGVIDYLGDTVLGYSYADRDDHCVIALWDFGGRNSEVEIPVGSREIEIADLMGNLRKVMPVDGNIKLRLSEAPVYLIGVSPELWGRKAVKHLRTNISELAAIVGSPVTLRGELDISGTVRLDFGGGLKLAPMTVAATPGRPFEFQFRIPAAQPTGKYPLTLKLLSNNKVVEAQGVLLKVKAPVDILDIHPSFVRNAPALELTLADAGGKGEKGMIETRIPGYPEARKRISFTLAPNERRNVSIAFDDLDISPFVAVDAQVKITLQSQYVFEQTENVNFLPATYLPGVGKNNDFSRWQVTKRYPVDNNAIRSRNYHRGPQDLSAAVAVGWNEQYLLFDVLVEDDIYLQPYSGWQIWNGDALQFGLARKRVAAKTANEFGEKNEQAFSEINFALTAKGAEADRTHTFDRQRFAPGAVSLADCPRSFTRKEVAGKTVIHYQIAVPWKFMNILKAESGMNVFWAAMINDRDQPKPEQSDVSALGVFSLKQAPPRHFGTIVLTR